LKGKFVSDISFHSMNLIRGRFKINQYKVFSRLSENKRKLGQFFRLRSKGRSSFSALDAAQAIWRDYRAIFCLYPLYI
jgi:hypothetical protein